MPNPSQMRATSFADRKARIRPGTAAAAFGALVGLAVGGAYLAGTAAKATRLTALAATAVPAKAAPPKKRRRAARRSSMCCGIAGPRVG